MAIDADEVLRIARLAHLEYPGSADQAGASAEPEPDARLFDTATLEKLATDVDRILEHVRELASVDVEGVPATSHGFLARTHGRRDEPGPTLEPDEALRGAPARDGDAFSVPKVVE